MNEESLLFVTRTEAIEQEKNYKLFISRKRINQSPSDPMPEIQLE
jgi:hypothetical protein